MNPLLLPAALLVDLVIGDPNFAYHPVRLLGRYAGWVERVVYSRSSSRLAGALAWLLVVGTAAATFALLLWGARRVHELLGLGLEVLAVYVAIAPRDLATHAKRVHLALEQGNLAEARLRVGAIVGRDTDELDESEVSRATVETVAESTVDGVTAPLFWAFALGPVGAIVYRAANTLDSLWGHKDARYRRFGMVAARADDALNFLPARLTLLFITAAAFVLRLNARAAFAIGVKHGPRHASPNSGLSEAAFAGALAVTLGGRNRYDGEWQDGPCFGDAAKSPKAQTIEYSLRLMWATTAVCCACLSLIGWSVAKALAP